jgi:hypothetical protein
MDPFWSPAVATASKRSRSRPASISSSIPISSASPSSRPRGNRPFARYAAELGGVEAEHRALGHFPAGASPPKISDSRCSSLRPSAQSRPPSWAPDSAWGSRARPRALLPVPESADSAADPDQREHADVTKERVPTKRASSTSVMARASAVARRGLPRRCARCRAPSR